MRCVPQGTRIDCAVRFVMKGKGYYDIYSNYGTLRIMPVTQEVVRVCFAKGQCSEFPALMSEYRECREKDVRCKARESMDAIEISTEKVQIKVNKKSGATSFLTPQGKVLLSEREKEPRQIGTEQVWAFFDWKKEENLIARGRTEKQLLQIGTSAKYISFGKDSDRIPAIASTKGYELLFPAKRKTLCCNIPMYGSYVSMEGTEIIDFYFKVR